MKHATGLVRWTSALVTFGLAGCGTHVPEVAVNEQPDPDGFLVNKIIDHVKGELRCAVWAVIDSDKENAKVNGSRRLKWLDTWSSILTIKLTADEKTSLNAGLTYTQPFSNAIFTFGHGSTVTTPRSSALGLGGSLSSDATHLESSDYTFSVKTDILDKQALLAGRPGICDPDSGVYLNGDLLIKSWLKRRTFPYLITDPVIGGNVEDVPPTTLSIDITFTVAVSGNVNPAWKLQYVSINTGASPLLNSGRTDTNEVILTLGPTAANKKTPAQTTVDAHNVLKTGSALSTAINGHQ